MRYALINNDRTEASPGLKGSCPGCDQDVIAKCGTQKIWHWAHSAKRNCDTWWEPETEWHRNWKSQFSPESQEVIQYDKKSGEKHIADVRTSHGLVIEFQHSYLKPEERVARESFYGNMIWIVDGTRLKNDYVRLRKAMDNFRRTKVQGYFLVHFPEECFPKNWLESNAPVIFDFQGADPENPKDVVQNTLWCLFPGRAENQAVVAGLSRRQFIDIAPTRPDLMPFRETVDILAQNIRNQRAAEAAYYRNQQNWRPRQRNLRRRSTRL